MSPVRTHKDVEGIGEYAVWWGAKMIVKPWGEKRYFIKAYK